MLWWIHRKKRMKRSWTNSLHFNNKSTAESQSLTAGNTDKSLDHDDSNWNEGLHGIPLKNLSQLFSLTAERQIWVRLTHGFQQTDFKHIRPRPDMLLTNLLPMCQSVLNKYKDRVWALPWQHPGHCGHKNPERSRHKECLITEKCPQVLGRLHGMLATCKHKRVF